MLLILRKRARLLYVELLKRISHLIFFFLSLRVKRRLRKSHVVDFFTFFRRKEKRSSFVFGKKERGLLHTERKKKDRTKEVVFCRKVTYSQYYSSNLRIKISSVNVGLALPPLSLKHAPTKKPFNFVFPDRYCSSWFGFISKTF
mgnify:CR=1 FL=1